jgi:hypothetical protein
MSYCRTTSMNGRCDIYCYGNISGGYDIDVAAVRKIPGMRTHYDMFKDWEKYEEWWKKAYKPIPLPHCGEHFHLDTLQEFKDKLLELRKIGYKFPNRVLIRINREIKEGKK